jgi:3-hydroxyisobutyrate dehydrogenase-like beta-hydroxyacid dehydrogenase
LRFPLTLEQQSNNASAMQASRVGVIGLGMMGGGIARALLDADLPVLVHDVRPEAATPLVELGARDCPSPALMAIDCEVVLVVVFDSAQVEDVIFGSVGLAGAVSHSLVVLVCSTIDPGDVEAFAARGAQCGIDVIDVGIAGGPSAAVTGTLVSMVGGSAGAAAAAKQVLDAMSLDVIHAGPVGSGMKLKLVKNTMSYLTMCAVHEALLLGEEIGFDAALVRRVAEHSNLVDDFFWFPMSRSGARPLAADDDPAAIDAARFFAAVAEKDLQAALQVGERAGVDLPAARLAKAQVNRFFRVPSND